MKIAKQTTATIELNNDEIEDLKALLDVARIIIDELPYPDSYKGGYTRRELQLKMAKVALPIFEI